MYVAIESEDRTYKYALTGSTALLHLIYDSWTSRTAEVENRYDHSMYGVKQNIRYYNMEVEQLPVVFGSDVSEANRRIVAKGLENIFDNVHEYFRDPFQPQSYFLVIGDDGTDTSTLRRALILEGSIVWGGQQPGTDYSDLRYGVLTISRHPAWESMDVSNILTNFITNYSQGALVTFPDNDFYGTLPNRISELHIQPSSLNIAKTWIGFKKKRGNYTNGSDTFTPWMDATLGDIPGGSGTVIASGVATFYYGAYTDYVSRLFLRPKTTDPTGNLTHYYGTYKVLMRARVTADSTLIRIGMRPGYSLGTTYPTQQSLYIERDAGDANFHIYDLGVFSFPPQGIRPFDMTTDRLDYYGFNIDSERITGSGNFEVDGCYLVPQEHSVYIDKAELGGASSDIQFSYSPDDVLLVVADSPGGSSECPYFANSFYMPKDASGLVVVIDTINYHSDTQQFHVSLDAYRRWLSHDGT